MDSPSVRFAIDSAVFGQTEVETAERNLEAARASARARLEDLTQLIQSGHTTGDPIRDFAILAYGDLRATIDHIFHDLSSRVLEHPGELVLVTSGSESYVGCTGFGAERQLIWVSEYKLGILEPNATGIVIELNRTSELGSRTKWSLPTIRYLQANDMIFTSHQAYEKLGDMSPDPLCDVTTCLLPRLTPDLDHKERLLRTVERRNARREQRFVDILIGDDEVLSAASENHKIRDMCLQLGVMSPERTLF